MAKKTKEQLRAEYEKAKKAGKIKEAGVGTVLSSAAKLAIKAAKATKAAKTAKSANAARQTAEKAKFKAGQEATVANKAKMEKLASTIKDYETRIANNKEAIKKLDLSRTGPRSAKSNYEKMTQGIKDIEKDLKEAKIQYMGLKNPWK